MSSMIAKQLKWDSRKSVSRHFLSFFIPSGILGKGFVSYSYFFFLILSPSRPDFHHI